MLWWLNILQAIMIGEEKVGSLMMAEESHRIFLLLAIEIPAKKSTDTLWFSCLVSILPVV
jgi:type IV secretory pathway TrbF-like protein